MFIKQHVVVIAPSTTTVTLVFLLRNRFVLLVLEDLVPVAQKIQ